MLATINAYAQGSSARTHLRMSPSVAELKPLMCFRSTRVSVTAMIQSTVTDNHIHVAARQREHEKG